MKKQPQVFLSGGIGNQLFQLAAALNHTSGKVILNGSLGNPRIGKSGYPDLVDYILPDRVQVSNEKDYPFWVKFLSDLLLRASSTQLLREKSAKRICLKFVANIAFSFYFRRPIKVQLSLGTGYYLVKNLGKSHILFGFFHTYAFPKMLEVKDEDLRSMALVEPSTELNNLINVSVNKRILIVHVRLGDYMNEPALGILTKEYFTDAISFAHEEQEFDEIWVFSASQNEALNYIPAEYQGKTRLMEGVLTSPAEILELMRNGDGYVLSNSTFSWWSAYLSHRNPVIVCVPDPWFRSAAIPARLIPDNWKRISW